MTKAAQNAAQLVQSAVLVMMENGLTEAQIVADLPRLAAEAVKFLERKEA